MRPTVLFVAVAWIALAVSASAQIGAFEWQLLGNQTGSGFQTPTLLHVTGPDGGTCTPQVTWYETVLPVGGTVSVMLDFQNLDAYVYKGNGTFDGPVWLIDGSWELVPQTVIGFVSGWPTGPYSMEFEAEAGERIGLGVWALDCSYGPGIADFHDLVLSPKPWSTHPAALDPRALWSSPAGSPASGALASAGDVDGDGHSDLVAPGFAVGAASPLRAFSGADGAPLFSASIGFASVMQVAGVGDIDGDGSPDVAAGAPLDHSGAGFGGSASIFSGADGLQLLEVTGTMNWDELGDRIAGIGDVDLDGVPDFAVRLVKVFGNMSEVRLLSGATGSVLQLLQPSFSTHSFGLGLAGAGDMTGDGVPDVLVGTPGKDVGLFSGATGLKAKNFLSPGPADFGESIVPTGDVDAGGTTDVVVGCPGANSGAGAVVVLSGETGQVLSLVDGAEPKALLGTSVSGGHDTDGDGRLDIVAGAPGTFPGGAVQIRDAGDGSLRAELEGVHYKQQLGIGVAMPDDLDGDGLGDLVATSSPINSDVVPVLHAWSRLDHQGPPQLAGSGNLVAGELVTATISNAQPGAPGFLVVGGKLIDMPVAGGVLAPEPGAILPVFLDADGQAAVSARWPAGLPVWSSLWMQAWVIDSAGPAGFLASDALAASQL